MRDIPMFTTEYGAASLFLKEIPYRGRAHIKIQSSLEPEKLLAECIGFCRACGAEWIDAAGDPYLARFPRLATLIAMSRPREGLTNEEMCLFPATEETMGQWLDIYNARMADVPNAAFLDSRDGREFLKSGDCYFVHDKGQLLGIGKAAGDFLDTVIAVKPGAGEAVLGALATVLTEDTVRLMVADTNTRAVKLYERLGFVKIKELSSWYRVL